MGAREAFAASKTYAAGIESERRRGSDSIMVRLKRVDSMQNRGISGFTAKGGRTRSDMRVGESSFIEGRTFGKAVARARKAWRQRRASAVYTAGIRGFASGVAV